MKKVRAPRFLTDLYRDLRDRRLLLPAIVLVVAIVAVPVALSSSSEAPPAPLAPPATGAAEETAAQPAVLAEQLGITNYRKRLEEFKSKNPFRQHFTLPEVTSRTEGSELTEPTTTTASSGRTGGGSTTSDSSTSDTSSGGSTSVAPAPPPPPERITRLLQRRIAVKVGPEGSLETRKRVKQLALLPNAGTPVVAFLGVSEDGKRALFLVSDDVTSVSGDGSCLTGSSTCQYLTLKPGEQASFDYAPDGLTYELNLLEIKDVVVSKTKG